MNKYLSLVKFSHTIFALPFAMIGFFLAAFKYSGGFSVQKLLLVIICMVTARSAAMAFNRYIDRNIDGQNERTAVREIPSGKINSNSVLVFTVVNSLLFILSTYFINSLCFYLSPVALFVILGYSLTKRFTFLCHLILGVGLSLAPIGAYLAVMGQFDLIPVLLGFTVLFWVAGFDIIYALQDADFDRSHKLFSIPSKFGVLGALKISRFLHTLSSILLIISLNLMFQQYPELQYISILAAFIFIGLLIYQHTLVKTDDFSKINLAFFTTNGIASLIFGLLIISDLYF